MCKIAIIESYALFSSGIKKILNEIDDFDVVIDIENSESLHKYQNDISPNVIVFDILNYSDGGIKSIKNVRRLYPQTPLLLIVSEDDGSNFEEYIHLGVKGLLLNSAGSDELIQAIHKLEDGEDYFNLDIWNIIKDNLRAGNSSIRSSKPKHILSERETDVARLFCEGLSYKEIGKRLNISPRTVESHRNNILTKLELDSLTDLIKYSLTNSL